MKRHDGGDMKRIAFFVVALACGGLFADAPENEACAKGNCPKLAPLAPHPRLFADDAAFKSATTSIPLSAAGRIAFRAALLRKADATMHVPVLERKMIGRRLLSTSMRLPAFSTSRSHGARPESASTRIERLPRRSLSRRFQTGIRLIFSTPRR